MALDLSAASLIRAGSGLTYVAVGLLVYAVGRRSAIGPPLALFCVAFGLGFAVINPLAGDPALIHLGLGLEGVLFFVAAGALVWLHSRAPWRASVRGRREAIALALALPLGVLVEALSASPSYLVAGQIAGYSNPFVAQWLNASSVAVLTAGAFLAIAGAFSHRSRPEETTASALVVVGVLGYYAYSRIELLNIAIRVPALFGAGAASCAMLLVVVATWTPRSRVVAWGLPALMLVGSALWASDIVFAGDVGIVRIIAALAIAVAVLRYDLLGVPLPKLAARRGTVATLALASLFIVAQVAQNFLSAQYGLLMGGVVAGAFLFAAQPLQRAFEGRAPAPAAAPSTDRAERAVENERVYKVALRRFHADGTISPEEEVALAHLADELGLTTRRATELRLDVERERGAR